PRTAVVLAPLLQVPARHVEADGIAEDVVIGALYVDAAPAFMERDYQLSFVMVVGGLRRVVHLAAAGDQREFALQEEKRRLTAVAAHLLLVLGVVSTDAEDAAHGKLLVRPRDRQGGRRPQGNDVGHRLPRKPAILFR